MSHPHVVTNRLKGPSSTIITVVNLAQQKDGELKGVEIHVLGVANVKRAWSCVYSNEPLALRIEKDGVVVTLPAIAAADVIMLE